MRMYLWLPRSIYRASEQYAVVHQPVECYSNAGLPSAELDHLKWVHPSCSNCPELFAPVQVLCYETRNFITKQTPWPESASELYLPRGVSAKFQLLRIDGATWSA
jgi:hypothetical protein